MMKLENIPDTFAFIIELIGGLGVIGVGMYYMINYPRFDDKWINIFHIILGAIVSLEGIKWIPFDKIKKLLKLKGGSNPIP